MRGVLFAICVVCSLSSVLSEDLAASTNIVLTTDDGKTVGKIQSHFAFPVKYQLKSGVESTAMVTVSNPTSSNTTMEGANLWTTLTWTAADPANVGTLQMAFTLDAATGDVTWTSAKLTVPIVNDAPFHFNERAKDYDSELTFDFTINRKVSNQKEKSTFHCSSVIKVEATKPYIENTTAIIQMSSTEMAVFVQDFAKDVKDKIVCAEDSAATTTVKPVAPTTAAPSMTGQWNVSRDGVNGTTVTCLMLRAAITLKITYEKQTGNSTTNSTVTASTSGISEIERESTCGGLNATEQRLALQLYDNKGWDLQLTFSKNDTTKMYALTHVTMQYALNADKQFPAALHPNGKFDSDAPGFHFNKHSVQAPLGNCYQCKKAATEIKVSDQFTLVLADLQVQAFTQGDSFKTPQLCAADVATSDLVPIIVGAALAALVVIVLVAYLIGRARARRQGYSSV